MGLVFAVLILFMIAPFVWILSKAFESGGNVFQTPPNLLPENPTLSNFQYVWGSGDVPLYFINSLGVVTLTVLINLIVCVLIAYPLGRMAFKGKNAIFIAILSTMMVPFASIMLPIFLMTDKLHLTNTYLGVALPTSVVLTGALGVYLLRQAFIVLPVELEEAARIDGCSEFGIFLKIMLPLVKPSLIALAIITFTLAWSDFLWPLIALTDPQKFTLPVGMQYFMSMLTANWEHISAVSVIACLPTVIIFIVLQRYFYASSLSGSIKG